MTRVPNNEANITNVDAPIIEAALLLPPELDELELLLSDPEEVLGAPVPPARVES